MIKRDKRLRRRFRLHARIEAAERPVGDSFDDAWIGFEPTFQTKECVELFTQLEDKEDEYFSHPHMVGTVKALGDAMAETYRKAREASERWTLFDEVVTEDIKDDWSLPAKRVTFSTQGAPPFEILIGMDPATFEFSLRPLPLAWLYDQRFVTFLEKIIYDVPQAHGLSTSLLNGGGQFHISAKTLLTGSLLCDDLAVRLSHPELATWMLDYPNCDSRSFRATRRRFAAFTDVVDKYRAGAFHPFAIGAPTVETAYFDHWPDVPKRGPAAVMDDRGGPTGGDQAEFQANFAFGRAVKMRAQRVHPGYWQLQHPGDDGYRPDQIMRYSETNLARLQIIGELHVKKDVPQLAEEGAFELNAPLAPRMLFPGASYEIRAQMSKRTAREYVDAVLLDVHAWRWLRKNPGVKVKRSLLQDQILMDADRTLRTHAAPKLDALRREARTKNRAMSRGRVRSDFVEPETLFWAAWHALPGTAQAAIAREAIEGFVNRVEAAASMDPRGPQGDPMEPHRHRVHPYLWKALEHDKARRAPRDVIERERKAFLKDADAILAKRPQWSQVETEVPPWVQK